MKTNLIFKRTVNTDGTTRVETKIVPVEIPYIHTGEGWYITGHIDSIEVVPDDSELTMKITESVATTALIVTPEVKEIKPGDKFLSTVPGTAKLYRRGSRIGIAYRRGKTTFNQNTKDSVCIDDTTKNQFFKDVHKKCGCGCKEYVVESPSKAFDFWNAFLDKEYERQRKQCNLLIERLANN